MLTIGAPCKRARPSSDLDTAPSIVLQDDGKPRAHPAGLQPKAQPTHVRAIGLGYPMAQLAAALAAIEQARDADPSESDATSRAAARFDRWISVLNGMATADICIGSRMPVQRLPAWVILEIAQGGLATGRPAAGGPLQAHERAALARHAQLPQQRAALNAHYLSDEGLDQLRALVASGAYRVTYPEEAALPIAAWLLGRGDAEAAAAAAALIDTLQPFMSALRFAPAPSAPETETMAASDCLVDSLPVTLATVENARQALSRRGSRRGSRFGDAGSDQCLGAHSRRDPVVVARGASSRRSACHSVQRRVAAGGFGSVQAP
jgi:hypothetical protein